jgi:6-pyruvoyltetrahydropterin/6-carboxytetrahydropterin synthase
MNYEISQRFFFDAAHTLKRKIEAAGSRRVHGHTYHCEVSLSGQPDAVTGMVSDLGYLRAHLETVREQLDHHYLDEVAGIGVPTLENLCAFVWRAVEPAFANITCVRVWRDARGDSCTLRRGVMS